MNLQEPYMNNKKGSQSYQRGIEIKKSVLAKFAGDTRNRTNVELKLNKKSEKIIKNESRNRTNVELKYINSARICACCTSQSYQRGIEISYYPYQRRIVQASQSYQRGIEISKVYALENPRTLAIVPTWN